MEAETLSGDEKKDKDLICKWIAVSYGQFDEGYHSAYSREVIRQSRRAGQGQQGEGQKKGQKDPVWF